MEQRVADLEEKISKLQSGVNKPKKDKKPRAPSEYNMFMGEHIKQQKNKLGEKYNHKEAFKSGAEAWKKSKEKS